eukprot:TRINITY_DN44895_c0_g1_i1.p3 TRINITY_DN44895_c0_g1~~TRINITY_DN44895_c0_g1_i1.p3  ORF type:complete len:117 (+),score=61.81 TRINITY_DN44895_c0_g1_i1:199-549(+)
MEEAGLEVELKGVLRVEYSPGQQYARLRVVFYAEPKDLDAKPKTVPDKESNGARWVTLDDLAQLAKQKPGLRGQELVLWGRYLRDGGPVYPMSVVSTEYDDVVVPAKSSDESKQDE